jgi:hypothetical protein
MIGTRWQNNYTKQIAKILSEPTTGVFELIYEEREGLPEYYQNSHRWAVRELTRHWRKIK